MVEGRFALRRRDWRLWCGSLSLAAPFPAPNRRLEAVAPLDIIKQWETSLLGKTHSLFSCQDSGAGHVHSIILNTGVRKQRRFIRDADAARDAKNYRKAALLYEKALRFAPDDAAIHIQCGHMFKEAGDLARAEHHYGQAKRLTPDDPDLALQLGHFYKIAGRPLEAERAYRRALDLDPDWPEPAIRLAELYRIGWRNHTREATRTRNRIGDSAPPAFIPPALGSLDSEGMPPLFPIENGLVPEIAPQPPESKLFGHIEEITIRWLGRRERTHWGIRSTVRGVDAIRGFCISATPIVELRATLNGLRFYSGELQEYPLKYEKYDMQKKKYVFNVWCDYSNFVEGLYDLTLQFVDEYGDLRIHTEQIVIGAPLAEDDYPDSDRLVSVSGSDNESLEEKINSRPSMIRPARRMRFQTPPRNVLVVRVDQLGDIIACIPAIRRLRELLPEARLVGLLSPANTELAQTLNLFDEIIVIDFREDEWERRRVMPLEKQHELRRRLEAYKFDVAMDLAEAHVSRPLLLLSGAPFLFGFKDDQAPWLSAYYEGWMVDPINGRQAVPITVKTLGLVEWFGAILNNPSKIIRREDLTWDRLAPYGLAAGDRFAVLHTGARLKFSQWPYYDKLASMIIDKTDIKVVLMTDDPAMRAKLAPALAACDRFQLLDKRLPFDDFDAFLSFCTVFVGNDSGPGHLASLRGANVVNLFLARQNWNEWGHENKGYIISRRVPCAGCIIFYDPDECGKDFACIKHIKVEEVFRTVMEFV
jgi:ADP-heptose:LPS heptosyltransferase